MNMRMTPAVKGLLLANVAAFVPSLFPFLANTWYALFALSGQAVVHDLYLWQVITYSFLHYGPVHFIFNMLCLYMFGVEVEEQVGTRRFLALYLFSAAGAGILSVPFFWAGRVAGASGALFAVMYVFARLFPQRRIYIFMLFPVPAMAAVIIFGALSLLGAISSGAGGIAHCTHLGGLAMGWLYWKYRDRLERGMLAAGQRRQERQERKAAARERSRQEFFEQEVDPILKKVSAQGLPSLTRAEKAVLARARNYRKET